MSSPESREESMAEISAAYKNVVVNGGSYTDDVVHEQPVHGGSIIDDPSDIGVDAYLERIERQLSELSPEEKAPILLAHFKKTFATKAEAETGHRSFMRIIAGKEAKLKELQSSR